MAKAETVTKEVAPVAAPAAPEPVFKVESNDAIVVEDNTEAAPEAEVAVTATEVPLMDGFVQVNYV